MVMNLGTIFFLIYDSPPLIVKCLKYLKTYVKQDSYSFSSKSDIQYLKPQKHPN